MRMKRTAIPVLLEDRGKATLSDDPANCVVECAFCRGSGRDPFDLLSSQAICQVCAGWGTYTLALPVAVCAYCCGSGVHPHSRLTCTSCKGVGRVSVAKNAVVCPGCGGTGREADYQWPNSLLSCNYCRGVGQVSVKRAKLFEGEKS